MNKELHAFIEQARAKKLDDAQITDLLKGHGWSDAEIKGALLGLNVPLSPNHTNIAHPTTDTARPKEAERPSISPLNAALQHVLLWLFTAVSTIMFSIAANRIYDALKGNSSDMGTFIGTFLTVEVIAFVPFAVFYISYLFSQKRQPNLLTGRVWSIITVVLHSIGLVAATIGFILTLILARDELAISLLLFAGATLILNLVVVAAYVVANFIPPAVKGRAKVLWLLPVVAIVLIGAMVTIILLTSQRGAADSATRDALVSATSAVHEYANDNNKLPDNLKQAGFEGTGVTYSKTSVDEYRLCADFVRTYEQDGYDNSGSYPISDSYVSTSDFTNANTGRDCFNLYNPEIRSVQEVTDYDDQTIVN